MGGRCRAPCRSARHPSRSSVEIDTDGCRALYTQRRSGVPSHVAEPLAQFFDPSAEGLHPTARLNQLEEVTHGERLIGGAHDGAISRDLAEQTADSRVDAMSGKRAVVEDLFQKREAEENPRDPLAKQMPLALFHRRARELAPERQQREPDESCVDQRVKRDAIPRPRRPEPTRVVEITEIAAITFGSVEILMHGFVDKALDACVNTFRSAFQIRPNTRADMSSIGRRRCAGDGIGTPQQHALELIVHETQRRWRARSDSRPRAIDDRVDVASRIEWIARRRYARVEG